MNRIFRIAQILDDECLTSEILDKLCRIIKPEDVIAEGDGHNRHRIYYELMDICGTKIVEALKSDLLKGEALFISGRVELFLTARGFDEDIYPGG